MPLHKTFTVNRYPLTTERILKECLPALGAYYLMAVLVVMPDTRLLRGALTPFVWALLGNGILHWHMAGGDPTQPPYKTNLTVFILMLMFMKATVWGLKATSYRRLDAPQISSWDIRINALDLIWSPTAIGWAHGMIAKTPDPRSKSRFLLDRLVSLIIHFLLVDFARFGTDVIGFPFIHRGRRSIFDPSLAKSPVHQYLVASTLTLLFGIIAYAGVVLPSDILAIIGVGLGGSPHDRWPPAFNRPWACTSLTELWSKGWHQQARAAVVGFGGRPLAFLARALGIPTRLGFVLGAFGASALAHMIPALAIGGYKDCWTVGLFFIMQGVGVLLESSLWWLSEWKGRDRKVMLQTETSKWNQALGWCWSWGWVLFWGNILVDAWARMRMTEVDSMMDEESRPARLVWRLFFSSSG